MKSTMSHQFSMVPSVQIPRSSFNRSHGHKTAFDAGYLVPIFVDEALPGDTFNMNMYGFSRMSTPVFPVMDNMFLDTFFFAVPLRLVWTNFQKFMGEQVDPGDSTDYLVPKLRATGHPAGTFDVGSLQDYMGIPPDVAALEPTNLFGRAYNLIWNEWFRDQNLQDSVTVDKDDGPDDEADYVLLRRSKRHDYFTSCLPWPQKGDSIELPLGTEAPVIGIGSTSASPGIGVNAVWESDGVQKNHAFGLDFSTADANTFAVEYVAGTGSHPNIRADLTAATAATINQLRQAFQLQRMMERDARGGSRYTEVVRSHFGVISPDARLQRPEYLGGGSSPINVTPVIISMDNPAGRGVGETGAFATNAVKGHGFSKSFTEHCIIIGMASVRADLTYQNGLNRMFSRQTREDFFWPSLAQIGEQAVLNKEIHVQGTAADDDVFGYQERYAEYRYKPSMVTGLFRSQVAGTLDAWHLAQEFSVLPQLNSTFIQEDPPIDRVVATPSEPHIIGDFYFDMRCARPMPLYGVPGMLDHF